MNRSNIVLSFIILLILLFLSNCKLFESRQNLVNLENESPESLLGIYWNASFNEDLKVVKRISASRPESFFNDCIEDAEINNLEENNHKVTEIDEEETFDSEKTSVEISEMSKYIFTSKNPFSRIKIKKKDYYENEAVLTILEADYTGNFNRAKEHKFYFRKDMEGWKLISILDKSFFDLWGEPKYGTPRPLCKK